MNKDELESFKKKAIVKRVDNGYILRIDGKTFVFTEPEFLCSKFFDSLPYRITAMLLNEEIELSIDVERIKK